VNASSSQLTVYVDGSVAAQAVQVGNVSQPISVTAGTHQVRLQNAAGTSTDLTVQVAENHSLVTVGMPSTSSGVSAAVLTDTGSIVPAGKSKLRVVHMSPNAGNIEIWRTQPDFQTPVHIMTPFPYGAESPYLQSNAGAWEVFVTASGSTTKVASTGAINIPSGERRTAILLDSAGSKVFRVISE
jgi:hypothetical protein